MAIKLKMNSRLAGLLAVGALAVSPVVAAAADNSDTDITATIGSTITVSTSGSVAVSLLPGNDPVVSSAADTVSVSTNSNAGYTLTLENGDATTDLASDDDTIAAHSGTIEAPSALANNTWGFAIAGTPFSPSYAAESNNTESSSLWAGVPASGAAVTLVDKAGTAANDQTSVWYGVRIDSSQPTGAYSDTVTYTATAK